MPGIKSIGRSQYAPSKTDLEVDAAIKRHDELVEKYKGTPYENYFTSNPFRDMPVSGGFLGLFRRQQEYKRVQDMANYDAGQLSKVSDLDYASPINQYKREAQAGLNSDLAGLGSPGSIPGSPGASAAGTPEEFAQGQFNDVTNSLLNMASIAVSIPETLSGLATDALQRGLSAYQFALERSGDFEDIPDDSEFSVFDNLLKGSLKAGSRAESVGKMLYPFNKRYASQVASMYRNAYGSMQGRWMRSKNAKELFDIKNDRDLDQELANDPKYAEAYKQFTLLALDYNMKRKALDIKYADLESKVVDKNEDSIEKNMTDRITTEGSELGARRAVAGAASSEAALRSDIAKNTEGSSVGEAETAESLTRKYEAEKRALDLKYIEEGEKITTSLLYGSPGEVVRTVREAGGISSTMKKIHRMRQSKRRRGTRQSDTPGVSIGPIGVGIK